MTQLDYARGTSDLKAENWAAALEDFNKGIANDPTYAKNYYGKAMALKNQDKWAEALPVYKKAIEVATAEGERQVAQQAQGAIRDQYIFLASSALAGDGGTPTRSGATEALTHLSEGEKHLPAPDADVFYYRAEAYKVLGEYDQSVAAADRALELHTGSKTDKAKIYFVKGESLMLAGQNDAAKLAFQEAQFGNFKASAQHYLETL
jgi:tetratricopeptide (TPR) repeat protein